MNKDISVVMPVFNNEELVKESIKSVLNQSFENFEFLIIDDGSTDKTYSVLKEYESDNRVKLYKNNKNIGLTKSLNKLIEISRGAYIFRQDSDDISFPERFKIQLDILKTSKYKVCTARAINSENNKVIPGISSWLPKSITMKYKNPYIHGTLAVEKNLLNSIGNYNEEYFYSQDYKLYVDILHKGEKIFEIKTPLYQLNTRNNISTHMRSEQRYFFQKAKRTKKSLFIN